MTTKPSQPKHDSWVDVDGWVFPNYDEKKFQVDQLEPMRDVVELSSPINSFEFQQGIYGQYRFFYHNKMLNNIHKQCLRLCIREDTLLTKNLTQEDKLCARECLMSEQTFSSAHSAYIRKARAIRILDSSQPIENVRI